MGNYIFSGHDTVRLAREYGTPLYVMSQDILKERIARFRDAFERTGADYQISYAGKAFMNTGMCRLIKQEGLGLDTASGGEIYTALAAGFPPEHITFHGSNKTEEELEYALKNGIGRIVVDSVDELERLDHITRRENIHAKVLFRINPGVEAHTHEFINTGKTDTKFGLPIDEAESIIVRTRTMPRVTTVGLHCHIGSQISSEAPFLEAADIMLVLYRKLKNRSIPLEELNLGGGFGIAYTSDETEFDAADYIPKMVSAIQASCADKRIPVPRICIESGRYIAGPAGITLYTVGTVKTIPGLRTYVSVDGGLGDNPRPGFYDAAYDAKICNRELTDHNAVQVRVSGRSCETDTLIKDIALADPTTGDVLAVLDTGAYNYTMASNYNRFPRPAVVLLTGGMSGILAEREKYEDLVRHDRIPEWLN